MAIRPFSLWPQHTLDTVTSRISTVYERWHDDWGLENNSDLRPAEIPNQNNVPGQAMQWQTAVSDDGGKCWFGSNSGLLAALGEAMFGSAANCPSGPDSIAAEASAACLAAFIEQVLAELQARSADAALPPDDEVWQPGSGALMLWIVLDDEVGCLVLSRDMVLRLCPKPMVPKLPAPLSVHVSAVLAGHRVSFRVSPGTVNLSLSEICSLAVGDVIALDAPLDRPLALLTSAGTRLCGVRLLRDSEHKVVSVSI